MAAPSLSKAAIDRAGKRLRDDGVPRPEDVAIYSEYRARRRAARQKVEAIQRAPREPATP